MAREAVRQAQATPPVRPFPAPKLAVAWAAFLPPRSRPPPRPHRVRRVSGPTFVAAGLAAVRGLPVSGRPRHRGRTASMVRAGAPRPPRRSPAFCPGRDAASMSLTPSCPSPGGWRPRAGQRAGVAPGQRAGRRAEASPSGRGGRTSTRASSREERRRRPSWLREEMASSILSGPLGTGSVGLGDVSPADPAAARHSARDSLLPASAWGPRRPRPRSHPEGQDGGPGAPLEPGPRVDGPGSWAPALLPPCTPVSGVRDPPTAPPPQGAARRPRLLFCSQAPRRLGRTPRGFRSRTQASP